jgi:lipopolysaccharide assembly outer membrane protein LptD (OstA)
LDANCTYQGFSIIGRTLSVLFTVLLFPCFVHAQDADTTSVIPAAVAAQADTAKKKTTGIDTIVVYSSTDSIVYSYNSRMMNIFGKGNVKYRSLGINSERISVNWNTNQMDAVGVLDTAKAARTDSLKQRYSGTPILIDGGEKYEGWMVSYNFKSQKGRITLGETVMEQGYYYGQHIKKVDKDMLFIADGQYTSCDKGHPHFYFFSPRMRITVRDKIVAEPIYLYVSDVPVFVLPFGVFPSQGGRRSGIIAPAYGDDARRGRYISHLGYYEAISDYMDLSLAGDWYTHGGWQAYSQFRYAKRYSFSGGLYGRYSRVLIGEPKDPDRVDEVNYYTNLRHNQQFNPTTRMDVDFTFASNNSFKTSNNYDDYLRQEIYSNATISKSWDGTNNSMTLNISRRQDLREGNVDATIPSVSFSHSQSYPFRSTKRTRGLSGGSSESSAWYELIGVGYNGQFLNKNNKTKGPTSVTGVTEFTRYDRYGASHSVGVNASPKAGYFTITPYFQHNERWYNKSTRVTGVDKQTNAPQKADVTGFEAVRFFNAGLSGSTKFYGMFTPPIPGVAGFRHTVNPSLTYNYQPDFSELKWGYYATYFDTAGRRLKYNRFEKEVYGGAPSGRSQSVSLNVSNIFEMKTSAKDTTEKENKYQLLNLNGSISYNFAADSLRLSDLSLNYRTDIGQYLGISGGATYRFYDYDTGASRRVNKFLLNEGKGIAALTNFNISLSTSLKGEKTQRQSESAQRDTMQTEGVQSPQSGFKRMYEEEAPDFSIPWNLNLSFNFSQSQEDPRHKNRSANVNAGLSFNLTENWRFNASSSYDLIRKEFAAPRVTIYRDLHCWEMNFSWTPIGQLAGYRFELKVKAPQLQDVKITKQSRDSGYY